MAFFRDDFRQCNSCGSMNNSKLSKCHSCGNSLRGFKTDIVASVVKKQIVTDQTKGSQSFWACKVCGEPNRSGNHYCYKCGEHWHSDGSKGLFESIADKVMDKTRDQGIQTPNVNSNQIKDAVAEKAAELIIKGLSKLFKK